MYLFFLFSQLQGSVWFYLPFYFVWMITRYLWEFFFLKHLQSNNCILQLAGNLNRLAVSWSVCIKGVF